MKRLLLKLILFFILLLIPVVILFKAPYEEEFVWHFIEGDCYNHGAWIFDRICRNPTPIDIAFIGSSHTIHAFQEKKMEELLASSDHLTNLGYCRAGRNFEYALLKMLLKYKTPKMVVIEVNEDEAKNSHEIFAYISSSGDVLTTPTLVNRDYFLDVYHAAQARIEYFKARYIFKKATPAPDPTLYGYGEADRKALKEELEQNVNAWAKRLKRTEYPSIRKIQMKYPFSYLSKMIQLLNDKHIPIAFVYLPESGSKLQSPRYASYYQNLGTLFIPPSTIFADCDNWMDATHFNDKGSAIFSEWMARQLKKELCIAPESPQELSTK